MAPDSIQPPISVSFRYIYPYPHVFDFDSRKELYAAVGIPPDIGNTYDTERLRKSVIRAMSLSPYRRCEYRGIQFLDLHALAKYLGTETYLLYWMYSENLLDTLEPMSKLE